MKKIIASFAVLSALLFTGCAESQVVPADSPEYVETYFSAPYMDEDAVVAALEKAGFEILGTAKVGKKKMPSIIFTNDKLKALANKPKRGFLAASLRVLVNKEANELKISNPFYFIKAFLQKEYVAGDEKEIMSALMSAFPTTTVSEDKWKYDGLQDYHFMIGMPYFQDQNVVGEADSVDELIEKIKAKAKKGLVFELKLDENRYVVGVRLSKRTEKFADKIGSDKAGILPWMVLIEEQEVDGKKVARASALAAEYNIAISYPLLDLGGFATIMSVPGAIVKDLEKNFK